MVRRVVGLGLVREVEGRQALGEEQGVATAAVDVDGPSGAKRSLLTDGAKPPVDLLRLRCGLEELHDLRVEAAGESRVLGETLLRARICWASCEIWSTRMVTFEASRRRFSGNLMVKPL